MQGEQRKEQGVRSGSGERCRRRAGGAEEDAVVAGSIVNAAVCWPLNNFHIPEMDRFSNESVDQVWCGVDVSINDHISTCRLIHITYELISPHISTYN